MPAGERRKSKPIIRLAIGLLSATIASGSTIAQDAPAKRAQLRPSYYACVKASRGVTVTLNSCIGVEHDFQDKRLNTAYQSLRTSLAGSERTALRDDERAWIVQRDSTCHSDEGGTAPLLDTNQCLLDQTAERATALEDRLSHKDWPANALGQRDFVTHQIFVDRMAKPGRVWLISTPTDGIAHAVEFFSGEKVDSVHLDPDGTRVTFSDASGHDYTAVKARTLTVNLDAPSSYAGWQDGDKGHEVILGARLRSGPSAADANSYFAGQASCEPVPYVVHTQGSSYQDSENGFVERTKIIADFDKANACWTSKPLQAVNLEDNTFLLATRDRVFRIDTRDLMPAGSAPDLKIIDINDVSR